MEKKLKITVITVVYNGIDYIEDTILSVINQDYSNIEYIIIDGKSDDGTMDIVEKYATKISYWVSESDNGIYDAMNKGIKVATGDWIIFMNCGDYFFSSDIITQVFSQMLIGIDVVYGGAWVRSMWGEFQINPCIPKNIWKGFVHQSVFVKCEVCKDMLFDVDIKAASDYDFIYKLYIGGKRFQMLDLIISNILYIDSGFSSVNEIVSKKDVLYSIFRNRHSRKKFIIHYSYHLIAYLRKCMLIIIRSLFPNVILQIRRYRACKR